MISILSIQFNNENPSYLGIEQSDFFRSKRKEHNLMQFPYTIPMSTHKLFQCNMHVFLFDFLNVNMKKKEICTYNQSVFHKNEYFYDNSNLKEDKDLRHFLLNEY